jgi:16S rRNA (uracil1498-N3)-methyltransferase
LNLFYQPRLSQGVLELDPEESLHASKVLRHNVGDSIRVTDGKGNLFQCEIKNISHKRCLLAILDQTSIPNHNHHIHIAFSPTKSSDRTEWFVEKATELGIQMISFIRTQHSERSKVNLDRVRKVSVSAMKQSGQLWLPEFSDIIDFKSILSQQADQNFIAHVDSHQPNRLQNVASKNKSYLILIGPEGDFSNDEITAAHNAGFLSVSLGSHVLRTETAGVAACHILNLVQH